ncbi:uncharacterized protein LOC125029518 [Penaeus chinensis]|uniref:uncharacterized protein LOC125029518 n=1 Tax=Penaeus chinensis TaxID=139456 RepID=UPI001FB78CC2|nr:uncharacterized protein LOC125029518 [Penaeus chinensis]
MTSIATLLIPIPNELQSDLTRADARALPRSKDGSLRSTRPLLRRRQQEREPQSRLSFAGLQRTLCWIAGPSQNRWKDQDKKMRLILKYLTSNESPWSTFLGHIGHIFLPPSTWCSTPSLPRYNSRCLAHSTRGRVGSLSSPRTATSELCGIRPSMLCD